MTAGWQYESQFCEELLFKLIGIDVEKDHPAQKSPLQCQNCIQCFQNRQRPTSILPNQISSTKTWYHQSSWLTSINSLSPMVLTVTRTKLVICWWSSIQSKPFPSGKVRIHIREWDSWHWCIRIVEFMGTKEFLGSRIRKKWLMQSVH